MAPGADDWRRMGQEKDLAGLSLTWKRYQASSGNWEHEHCEFCFTKFLDSEYVDWMRKALVESSGDPTGAGYCNLRHGDVPSGRHWICRGCFEDFVEEFRWVVVESDREAWPYDTPEPLPRPTERDYKSGAEHRSV